MSELQRCTGNGLLYLSVYFSMPVGVGVWPHALDLLFVVMKILVALLVQIPAMCQFDIVSVVFFYLTCLPCTFQHL